MISKKKIFVIAFFALLGLLADQIKVSAVWGARGQTFTLLQLFAPAVGAFLGGVSGAVTVLLTEVASFIIQGKEVTVMNVFRLLPLMFATLYFASIMQSRGRKSLWIEIGVPALAMLIFWEHHIGRLVWYYALYWTIPIIISLTPLRKTLVGKSLGSTFTAHAVGGAYWIWATNMAAPLWTALIPVVAIERAVFGLGIALTFLAVNYLLSLSPVIRALPLHISRRHLWPSRA
ncbi:MAG: hypothetical protein AB1352_01110 [Patescibacteria group bacterium]